MISDLPGFWRGFWRGALAGLVAGCTLIVLLWR
jgi:hypothetical protein